MPYSDKKGRINLEVRMHDGENREGTAYGTILRKPAMGRVRRLTDPGTYWVNVGGERLMLQDPHGSAHVFVTKFPRDMDEQGYG